MTPKVKKRSSVLEMTKPTKWSTWEKAAAQALFGSVSAVHEYNNLTRGGSEPP